MQNLHLQPRQAFLDRTNQPDEAQSSLSQELKSKRRAEDDQRANKRAKLVEECQNEGGGGSNEVQDIDMRDAEPERAPPKRRRPGVYGMLNALRMGDPAARRMFTLPTTQVLETFVSSNKTDLYKCHSVGSGSYLTPPYACAFTHASKRGNASILAVATEEGSVNIINTSKRRDWELETPRTTIQVHQNGIFDVKWSLNDAFIATASGDNTVHITDPQSSTGSALHVLEGGHRFTVKCIAWDPTHRDLITSGSRDGCICLWDLRERKRGNGGGSQSEAGIQPVMKISYAHEVVAGKPVRKGRASLAPKSVTSLVYLDSTSEIVSSGSADGILRKWDLRYTPSTPSKRSKKPTPILPIDNAVVDFTSLPSFSSTGGNMFSPRRSRGISSLTLGCGSSAGRIFALGNDSRIHTYNALGAVGTPLDVPQMAQTYSHRHMATNSFYVRVSMSPCGRWLASGGAGGSAFLFDVGSGSAEAVGGVELKGQEGEVGAVDWAEGALATCADDGTVRIWRPDIERQRACINDPTEAQWDWSWGRV